MRDHSFVLAAAIVSITAITAASAGAAPREPSWPRALTEYRQLLADLIAIDSTSPPGNELAVAERLRVLLEKEGIPCQVFEPEPGRANLVARLAGKGGKRPLLLLGHIDVVGVEREHWETDPFQIIEKDGHFYGRGVIDDKGMVAAEALTLLWLKRLQVPLDRDVIFLAECDEESEGKLGVAWMLEHHRQAIDAEYALNEGGRVILAEDEKAPEKIAWIGIQTAEKHPVNVKLKARGTSGHASIPRRDNAIAVLGRAVARFAEPVFPVSLTPETRIFFPALAALQSDAATAYAMRHLDHPDSSGIFGRKVGDRDPLFAAMLRNTVSPTLIDGGFRSNAIPAEAEATLNCRLLPGSSP